MPIVGGGLRCLILVVLDLLLLPAAGQPAMAQNSVRQLQVEDIAQGSMLAGEAALSPDGAWVAYTVCDRKRVKLDPTKPDQPTTRPAATRLGCVVWVAPAATGTARPVLLGASESWGPAWSPDGRVLAFYADRGGAPRVWLWDPRRRKARQLAPAAVRAAEVPVWAPASRQLLVTLPAGGPEAKLAQQEASPHAALEEGPPRVPGSTVVIYRSVAPGSRAPRGPSDSTARHLGDNSWHIAPLGDLAVMDVATGRTRVLAPRIRSNAYRFSPDGNQIAYTESRGRLSEGDEGASTLTYVYDLVVLEVATAQARVVVPRLRQWEGKAFSWSPDGHWLAYLSGAAVSVPDYGNYTIRAALYLVAPSGGPSSKLRPVDGGPDHLFRTVYPEEVPLWDLSGAHLYLTDNRRVWRATVATLQLTPLTPATTIHQEAIIPAADGRRIWAPVGGTALYVLTEDSLTKRSGVYQVPLVGGGATRLREEAKRYSLGAPTGGGGSAVLRVQSATESPDLWLAEAGFTQVRRLTTLNPQLSQYTFGSSRLIDFHSIDGQPLQAALLLPAGYVEGKCYPLVVYVYASDLGSRKVHDFGLDGLPPYNAQVFSTRGYAVLWPDIPVGVGTPVQDLMKAVMPAIDRVVALGIADPKRLAVMGQSNGGYSTLALLTQTRRFKAGVMIAGFGNLVSLYGVMSPSGEGTWIGYLEGTSPMRAPPWAVPQRYVENSPVFYLDRVQTPLLMEVGGADQEIVTLSNEVFVGLKRLGREVTYLRYEGEGHYLQQWANVVDYWNRVLAFLGRYLTPASPTDAGPPERAACQS